MAENLAPRPPPAPLVPGEFNRDRAPCRTPWARWTAADEDRAAEEAECEGRPEPPTAGPWGAFAMLLSNAYARCPTCPGSLRLILSSSYIIFASHMCIIAISQLVSARCHHICQRNLKGGECIVLAPV